MISNMQQQHCDNRIIVGENVITEKLPVINSTISNSNIVVSTTFTTPNSANGIILMQNNNNYQTYNFSPGQQSMDNDFSYCGLVGNATNLLYNPNSNSNGMKPLILENHSYPVNGTIISLNNNIGYTDANGIPINGITLNSISSSLQNSSHDVIVNSTSQSSLNTKDNNNYIELPRKNSPKPRTFRPLELIKSTNLEINKCALSLKNSPIDSPKSKNSPNSSPVSRNVFIFSSKNITKSSPTVPEKDAAVICNGWKTLQNSPMNDNNVTSTNEEDLKNSNLYRRSVVEDVHNYSKKSPTNSFDSMSSPSSSCNSVLGSIDDEDYNMDDFYESDDDAEIKRMKLVKRNLNLNTRRKKEEEDEYIAAGVNITGTSSISTRSTAKNCEEISNNIGTPMHHARRPMNAFLIFCKRHRAIVKERFNNVENRQITKILGDWWENLGPEAKSCYSNLAKDYKDAFLSANPDFQWYKLPAPPLRSLPSLTSPMKVTASSPPKFEEDNKETQIVAEHLIVSSPIKICDKQEIGVFKFADEAQMGGLSSLLNSTTSETQLGNKRKSEESDSTLSSKKFSRDNSFSSSGEDDLKPSRTCKGKKYLELINSGQIGLVVSKKTIKKAQQSKINNGNFSSDGENSPVGAENLVNDNFTQDLLKKPFDSADFDLESKIMALVAQNLDQYLEKKDNEKSKQKIKVKRRIGKKYKYRREAKKPEPEPEPEPEKITKEEQHPVGSQKRKARKESITRRDITALENQNQILHLVDDHGKIEIMEIKSEPHENEKESLVNNNNVKWGLLPTSDLSILAEVASSVID